MKNYFTKISIMAATYHIKKANDMIILKTNNIAIYGKEYSKTFQCAGIELSESWHLLMFNFFNSFIKIKE